jgi:hypothetical protein
MAFQCVIPEDLVLPFRVADPSRVSKSDPGPLVEAIERK